MKILIADDHAQNRYLLEQLLGGLGHRVVSVKNGREALDKLRAEPFEAVVSDILMPEMDGFQLCREIRADAALQSVPFIFYTATYTDPKDEKFAYDLGADGYMTKPTDPEIFIPKLNEFIAQALKSPRNQPPGTASESEILQTYNQRLIHKLESKIEQLEAERARVEAANRAVQSLNSELMAAVAALREGEARFREVYQHSSDCISIYGVLPDGTFVFEGINRAMEDSTGLRNAAVIGRRPEEVLPAERLASLKEFLDQCVAERRPVKREESFICRGEEVVFSTSAVPVFNAEGRLHRVVLMSHDLTAEHRAAEDQRVLEEQLFQAQKMEALGTLSGGIAHDFNNLLGAILGNSEMAMLDLEPAHPARESVEEISRASLRARDLVQQILTFSRKSRRKLEPTSMDVPVQEAVRLLRATLPPQVRLATDIPPNLPPVLADGSQVHQIVVNLCTNAWHALPQAGGQIDVALSPVNLNRDLQVLGGSLGPGRYVRLTINDNGSGMDEPTLQRAFEPFFTTKEPGRGTGLGLAVVHGIIQTHRGGILVDTSPGRGSRFDLYFPATTESTAAEAGNPPNRASGERVLFVDDEEMLLRNARRILELSGYRFSGLSDPKIALAEFRQNPAGVDLAITDIAMPGMTGIDLVREIRKIRNDLPVVVVTGYSQQLTEEIIRELKLSRVVLKPYTISELLAACADALKASK